MLFCGLYTTCKKSIDSPENENDYITLEQCYQDSSLDELASYLDAWHAGISPVHRYEYLLLSDTMRSIYQIFVSFYDPFDLGKYCTTGRCPEFGIDFYAGLGYIIVQNEIGYSFDPDTLLVLKNFRPPVEVDAKTLYLTDEYKQEFDSFLNNGQHPGEIGYRWNFLNQKLRIMSGHWFGWHFLTHPEVEYINFSPAFNSATVYFRIIYEGGEAKFKRETDEWEFIESYLTWIE
jgi:hypothetical protein